MTTLRTPSGLVALTILAVGFAASARLARTGEPVPVPPKLARIADAPLVKELLGKWNLEATYMGTKTFQGTAEFRLELGGNALIEDQTLGDRTVHRVYQLRDKSLGCWAFNSEDFTPEVYSGGDGVSGGISGSGFVLYTKGYAREWSLSKVDTGFDESASGPLGYKWQGKYRRPK
jgi:hypothetical protein